MQFIAAHIPHGFILSFSLSHLFLSLFLSLYQDGPPQGLLEPPQGLLERPQGILEPPQKEDVTLVLGCNH